MKKREMRISDCPESLRKATIPTRAIEEVAALAAPPTEEAAEIHAHLVAELLVSHPASAIRLCYEIERRFGWKYRFSVMTLAGLNSMTVAPPPATGAAMMML